MKIEKYILKKFDYNVNISNKNFYTPNETISQKLEINIKFLKNKKNVKLNFKISIFDKEEINISKLKIEYILELDQVPSKINNKIAEKIVSSFYPILNEFVQKFYYNNGLKNIELPKF